MGWQLSDATCYHTGKDVVYIFLPNNSRRSYGSIIIHENIPKNIQIRRFSITLGYNNHQRDIIMKTPLHEKMLPFILKRKSA